MTHFVYMLRCADGSLYTGAAKDWKDRLKLHMDGRAAKYTRGRRPVRLAWLSEYDSKSTALTVEATIKRLPKRLKEHWVRKRRRVGIGGRSGAPARRRDGVYQFQPSDAAPSPPHRAACRPRP